MKKWPVVYKEFEKKKIFLEKKTVFGEQKIHWVMSRLHGLVNYWCSIFYKASRNGRSKNFILFSQGCHSSLPSCCSWFNSWVLLPAWVVTLETDKICNLRFLNCPIQSEYFLMFTVQYNHSIFEHTTVQYNQSIFEHTTVQYNLSIF